jgi:uncharacterized lipoprotein YddW (UPF0748 family)
MRRGLQWFSWPVVLLAAAVLLPGRARAVEDCPSRYFWVVRDDLTDPESIDSLIERAAEAGANGLIVQVVGRAEAYYNSSILPPADFQEGFDPLAYLTARAKPRGLEVHAWVNAFLVWSESRAPSDTAHVWWACPDWFMSDRYGRSTREYSREECDAASIVGATLSPAVPEVREFLAAIAVEIALNYDVDGIHLDYIRYPNPSFGFEPAAVGAFFLKTGMDPMDLTRSQGVPEELEQLWADWRTEQVTLTVSTVREALRSESPGTLLSAAVMADPFEAPVQYSCDWRSWLQDGLVDFVCTMAYTSDITRATELAELGTGACAERVVHGIGVYNQSTEAALPAAAEALRRGAGGICVFSLSTLPQEDTWILRNFWGETGRPEHRIDASLFHRVADEAEAGL